jgi:predicted AAA+ superfamily ATPase
MLSVPRQLGHKFTYSEVKQELKSQAIKQAIHLLNKSRVCSPITYSASNGVPIGAEINEKYFKQILVDVGLCSASLGLDLNKINQTDDITLINSGGIAEQVTGQLLRTIFPSYIEPKLYYWQRIEKGAEAEVDYVIQHKNLVIPIEVKAGTTGSLKSLHIFMGLKSQRDVAVRINSDYPSITSVNMTNQMGNKVNYNLVSIPFYLVSELHRLLDTIIN